MSRSSALCAPLETPLELKIKKWRLLAGSDSQQGHRVSESEACNSPRIPIVIELESVGREMRDGCANEEGHEQTDKAGKQNAWVKAEHADEHCCGGGEIVGTKENPADHNEKKGRDALKRSGQAVPGLAEEFVEAEKDAVVATPNDEGPVGAMPEAAEKHGDQKIAIDEPVCGDAAAAERDVKIVAQAGRE
jgi:hypothetical protein